MTVDGRELIILNSGAVVRKEPNGEFALVAVPSVREQKAIARQDQRTATAEDALIETYLKHKNVTGYYEREARAVWALYKQLTNGKPLKEAAGRTGASSWILREAGPQERDHSEENRMADRGRQSGDRRGKAEIQSVQQHRAGPRRQAATAAMDEADIRNVRQQAWRLDEGDRCYSACSPRPACGCRRHLRSTAK